MYDSIAKSLGEVQSITIRIHDQVLQRLCVEIIRGLDEIERTQRGSEVTYSNFLRPDLAEFIDDRKLRIVKCLLEIRRMAKIPMQLPFALRTDHFWSGDQADAPPEA
jgi:sporulation protein YlmC with PRC-barrel domain